MGVSSWGLMTVEKMECFRISHMGYTSKWVLSFSLSLIWIIQGLHACNRHSPNSLHILLQYNYRRARWLGSLAVTIFYVDDLNPPSALPYVITQCSSSFVSYVYRLNFTINPQIPVFTICFHFWCQITHIVIIYTVISNYIPLHKCALYILKKDKTWRKLGEEQMGNNCIQISWE